VRLRCASVGRIGDAHAIPKLIAALNDEMWDVRYAPRIRSSRWSTQHRSVARGIAKASQRRPHILEALAKLGYNRAPRVHRHSCIPIPHAGRACSQLSNASRMCGRARCDAFANARATLRCWVDHSRRANPRRVAHIHISSLRAAISFGIACASPIRPSACAARRPPVRVDLLSAVLRARTSRGRAYDERIKCGRPRLVAVNQWQHWGWLRLLLIKTARKTAEAGDLIVLRVSIHR